MREIGKYYPCKVCENLFLLADLRRVCCEEECGKINRKNHMKRYHAKYRVANSKKLSLRSQEYNNKNKLKRAEIRRRHYLKSKEKILLQQKAYRRRRKEELRRLKEGVTS